jgi:hypothetical protein
MVIERIHNLESSKALLYHQSSHNWKNYTIDEDDDSDYCEEYLIQENRTSITFLPDSNYLLESRKTNKLITPFTTNVTQYLLPLLQPLKKFGAHGVIFGK